ncbi:MAG TPA: hypothetical protein DEB39_06950 [Planctomycetaceae bacterium]|nr:hypothetical protein [Planctomycetaceae bacterium]
MPGNDQPTTYRPVPFNFIDLEEKATEYLAKVRQEAQRITREVKTEVERLRTQAQKEITEVRTESARVRTATEDLNRRLETEVTNLEARAKQTETDARERGFAEGKKAGYEEGQKAGYADGELQANLDHDERVKREAALMLEKRLETLLPALEEAAADIRSAQHSFLAHWERAAIQVAAAMAQRVIMQHLPEMPEVPFALIREALELGVGSSLLRIRMNPGDHAALLPRIEMIVDRLAGAATTEIVPDDRVTPGGCILETSLGTIDQRIESRLDRIRMELV